MIDLTRLRGISNLLTLILEQALLIRLRALVEQEALTKEALLQPKGNHKIQMLVLSLMLRMQKVIFQVVEQDMLINHRVFLKLTHSIHILVKHKDFLFRIIIAIQEDQKVHHLTLKGFIKRNIQEPIHNTYQAIKTLSTKTTIYTIMVNLDTLILRIFLTM